jgi:mycothiol system anti-sigma-R factor
MLCDDVKRFVYFYLDGQLGKQKASDFDSHIGACRHCDDRLTIHKRLRSFITRHLTGEPVPDRLRERIRSGVAQLRNGAGLR